jgi:glycerol uptake facilitator-like aquaporin
MATKKAASKKTTTTRKSTSSKTTRTSVKTAPARVAKQGFVMHVQESLKTASFWRALAAEFVGTFLLAGVIVAGQGQPIFVLFGLVGVVLLVGAVSGAHVNPAVTIGALVTRRIGWLRALGYILFQLAGAAVAYFALTAFLGGAAAADPTTGQTAPALFKAANVSLLTGKEWFVFFSEMIGTAILGFVYANVTREKTDRVAAAFTAGLGIFVALMFAVSTASYVGATGIINPAVAVSLQAYNQVWSYAIYALAPVIGAVFGFVVFDLIRGRADK